VVRDLTIGSEHWHARLGKVRVVGVPMTIQRRGLMVKVRQCKTYAIITTVPVDSLGPDPNDAMPTLTLENR
jgi:hypothetical protein